MTYIATKWNSLWVMLSAFLSTIEVADGGMKCFIEIIEIQLRVIDHVADLARLVGTDFAIKPIDIIFIPSSIRSPHDLLEFCDIRRFQLNRMYIDFSTGKFVVYLSLEEE